MKAQTWFDSTRLSILPNAILCALMFCSGCLQHKVSILGAYRIDDEGGVPMLLPSGLQGVNSETFQNVTVTLPAAQAQAKTQVRDDCAIHGVVFSMLPSPRSGNNSWVVKSPSASGWVTVSGETDVYAQWKLFIRELARVHDRGCFPSGLSTQLIRSAIASRIPIPANEVPIYMYSDQGERFVNLAPGMEIRIQRVLLTGKVPNSASVHSLRISTLVYDVTADHGAGVQLRRNRSQEGQDSTSLGSKDKKFLTLDQRFVGASVLRLFLQGFSENEAKSNPILIGASDTSRLDAATDLVWQRDHVTCVDRQGIVCIEFPPGSISLFSTVWVNGHKATCPFGAPLTSILFPLSPFQQGKALESIRVMRRLDRDRYANIQFRRTPDGARQVLLLAGDRIEWHD